MQNMEWYQNLDKPFLNPPDSIFMPVWSVLYILITMSFIFFIKSKKELPEKKPLIFFFTQLILNFLWPVVFFGIKNISMAFIVICFIWIFIILTIIAFYRYSKLAAALLLPYWGWVSFALYLNFMFLKLNE